MPRSGPMRHGERMTTHLQHGNLCLELAAAQNADGWIMLFPAGVSRGADGRGPYSLSDMQAVIAASTRPLVDIAVDRDHQFDILPPGAEKVAAGWIKELQARADGIYGRVVWTPRAQQQLADGEYRYISPGFLHDRAGNVKRIFRASLVNDPNLEMKAVAAADRLAQLKETDMDELLKKLAEILGLPADTGEASIVDAIAALKGVDKAVKEAVEAPAEATAEEVVEKIETHIEEKVEEALAAQNKALAAKGAGNPDPAKFVPIAVVNDLQKDLASVNARLLKQDVDKAVGAATTAGKILPSDEQQEWARTFAAKDMDGFEKWVAGAPVIVKPGAALAGKQRGGAPTAVLDDEQKALCANLGISEDAYIKALAKKQQ